MPSINTNLPALTAQRNLASTQIAFHKTVTRLSSGLRINSAADDAAGLFISEKLKNQVKGLNQASRNAQDGMSLLQTAEGGLSVHHDILLRMRELAVQSANGIMTDSDRALTISAEVKALSDELSRTANSTQFNGVKLLDGTLGGVQVTGVGQTYGNNARLANAAGVTVQTTGRTDSGASLTSANGIDSVLAFSVPAPGIAGTVANTPVAFELTTGVYAPGTDSATITLTQFDSAGVAMAGAQTMTVNGVSTISGSRQLTFSNGLVVNVNSNLGAGAGITATTGGFAVSNNLKTVDIDGSSAATIETTSALPPGVDGLVLQVGANNVAADRMTLLNLNAMTSEALGLSAMTGTGSTSSVAENVKTQSGAQAAIDIIDNAITQVSTIRSKMGAYQNRLEYTVTNLGVAAENQQAAASRIVDADVAAEVSEMVRTQILSQSAMAILAQANAAPQALLSLFS